jgi:hypothetical protein
VRAVWQHGREVVVCLDLEEAVWFKWDCQWTSSCQSILESGG